MIQKIQLFPGITLRCFPDHRFKHGCLSIQLVRPMCRQEAAQNALLPAVLLRGSRNYPDLRDITLRLDDLYGASVSALVRRVGDYQTTGLFASFTEDRFAMEGDKILSPMVTLLKELLRDPLTEDGVFCADFVDSEKKNLVATIESQLNDKRAWAMEQMLKEMCREDSFGIPRLGEKDAVESITARSLYEHYRKILRESRIDLFYVGSESADRVTELVMRLFDDMERNYVNLPEQTAFRSVPGMEREHTMDVNQGKLCMGFVTPVTIRDEGFVATQVMNTVFGGGMTSKLFSHIREELSLCYAIGSGYHGAKGIVTVSAGIDSSMGETVRREVLKQLEACRSGEITPQEMNSAKQALRSGLLAVHDSPGAIENYYATAVLSGLNMVPSEYLRKVEQTTLEQVQQAARETRLHSVFFLKGVGA